MEESDSAAIVRVNAGDGDAYRTLVERYSRAIFRLAYRMTGNAQDAEDVVQETFLRAYRHLHRWEGCSSFSTWLYRIAANCSLDLIRSRKRHNEVDLAESRPDAHEAPSPGPDRLLASSRIQECVAATLDELSHQERAAFVLRHFEGQSIDAISSALGVSGGAAKHTIFRAVQKLRRALGPLVNL
jgi:RNA polymerase sigma-70 factor (ECF subfamily)